MEFSCTPEQSADHTVFTVVGDIDLAAHTRLQRGLDESWDASTDLVLDCSGVTFLDSMGLRVLVHALQRATAADRTITLAAPSQPVLRVLELAGVRELFPVTGPLPDTEPSPAPPA
jgi:anti-anti-sigma factor